MAGWVDRSGRTVTREKATNAKVELLLDVPDGVVVISSNPRLHIPNFDRCRRDKFCRCVKCKPSQAAAHG